uniref:Uncharacterized protein n=1 Tax=Timema tahoe TaxID=61484 RepID=A0A7R9FMJ2_9NEOP|nr:unnamed protein product [Timema tahoe]
MSKFFNSLSSVDGVFASQGTFRPPVEMELLEGISFSERSTIENNSIMTIYHNNFINNNTEFCFSICGHDDKRLRPVYNE